MLSDRNIDKINRQIDSLLFDFGFERSAEKKSQILDEINGLKNLLTPQPSTEEIVRETLATLCKASEPKFRSEPTISDILCRLFDR